MSDSLIEMEILNENNNINNISEIQSIYQDSLDFSNISKISKSTFAKHYHFLCKYCYRVPIIRFIKDNKIRYICECKNSPKDLNINEIYNFLYYFDEIDLGIEQLKCYLHSKEYGYFCEKCKKNLCPSCFDDCSEHKNKIISLLLKGNTIDKYCYIYKKIKDKNQNYIDIENSNSFISKNKLTTYQNDEDNSFYNNIEDSNYLIRKKNDNLPNKDEKIDDIINTMKNNNNDEIYDDEFYIINLFTIILNDYLNFPNINHIETIANIEIYIIVSFHDYNEIKLNYEFEEDNSKMNIIELFGEKFVDNNKENCFLIINEKIIELSRFINLYDIFENIPTKWPIQLNVLLIERKYYNYF